MPKRLWFMDVCGLSGKRVRLCQAQLCEVQFL